MAQGLLKIFQDNNNLYGLKDKNGNVVVDPKYTYIDKYDSEKTGLMEIYLNKQRGLMDARTGKEVISPKYDYIRLSSSSFTEVKLNGKYGAVDLETSKEIVPIKYDYVKPLSGDSIAKVRLNEKYGAVDLKTGEEVISPKYDDIELFPNGITRLKLNGKFGAVELKTNKEIVPFIYDGIGYIPSEGIATIRSGDYFGLFDITNGKEIIVTNKYDAIDFFRNGVAQTRLITTPGRPKYGLINVKTGEEIVATKYDYIFTSTTKDTVSIKLDKKYGLMEWKTGKEIVAPKYENLIGDFNSDGLANVQLRVTDGKSEHIWSGLINRQGEEVVPCVYDRQIEQLNKNGLYRTSKKEGYGLITLRDQVKEILPPKYYKITYYNDNLIVIDSGEYFIKVDSNKYFKWRCIINGEGEVIIPPRKYKTIEILDKKAGYVKGELLETEKWGIIDVINKIEILPFKYDTINEFNTDDGIAMAKLNGKWGAVNKEGKEILPFKYDEIYKFRDGLANVRISNKYGLINTKWKEVLPVKYDNTYPFNNGLAKVKISNKYGLINTQFEEVLPVKYDMISEFNSLGLAKIQELNKFGLINNKGELIAPVQYGFIGVPLIGTDVFFVSRYGKRGYMDKDGNEIPLEKYGINFEYDYLFNYQCNAQSKFSFASGKKISVSGSTMTLTEIFDGKIQPSSVLHLPIAAASANGSESNVIGYMTYDFYENDNNYKYAIIEVDARISPPLLMSITLVSDRQRYEYCNDTKAAAEWKNK